MEFLDEVKPELYRYPRRKFERYVFVGIGSTIAAGIRYNSNPVEFDGIKT